MIGIYATYVALGAVAGVLAGLLGIGGGIVIVPILVFSLQWQGVSPDVVMHLALGTSLSTIVFTSLSSTRAHNKRGGVDWRIFKGIAPGVLVGTFLGSCVASYIPGNALKLFFALFLLYVSYSMFRNSKPKPTRQLPGGAGLLGAGTIVGAISSLVGVGGGIMSVPFLVWCNVAMHTAIGTAAAIGLPLALAGSLGYIINGQGVVGLPLHSWGFVYLPALIGISCMTIFTAPLGAKLAHSLPVPKLKRIFAVLLAIVSVRMLFSLM
ncbi:MAG: sulfite exporter TauE/SafE family protein [Desulfovibrio sp.]|uniref:sulfite exporter TauE/SafE family protein n=1 Tax=Desulfovibrio sp. 7SRBS1 TaxID=3378064 RepID=UPI003B41A1FB